MKLVALVGSIRKQSFNKHVAEFFIERYSKEFDVEILDIAELPYFDEDLEEDPPSVVKHFKKKVAEAEGVLIVTPEYNHSVPGVLKNSIDWLSRGDRVMIGKPVLIMGSSTGMLGTVRCQMHLRQILAAPGLSAKVLPGNEVLIAKVQEKLNNSGKLADEATIGFIDTVVENFKRFAKETVT